MTEILLGVIILALIGYHAWYVDKANKKEASLLRAAMSKDMTEFLQSEVSAKNIDEKDPVVKMPDLVPIDELDDKDFDKAIGV